MRKIRQKAYEWMVILGISILVSVPLLARGIYRGHDIGFHLLRIEGIAEELRRLQVPVRMQSLWLDGYGYPVSIYYGDIFLYIPAIFRLLGVSVTAVYKVYVFLINMAATTVAYLCFEKIWNDRLIAAVVCLAYVTAGYRMIDIYVRAAVGEYNAMIFFPLIALSVYKIYQPTEYSKAECRKCALLLSIGMTGVLENHILSTEMAVFVLILAGIVLWKRTFHKKIILSYLLAIAETTFLNLYFIVPFLDYYCNMRVNIVIGAGEIKRIQQLGAYPIQYIDFFQDIFGLSSSKIHERMQLSPGPLLMFSLVLGLIISIRYGTKRICIYMGFSLLMLFMASNVFPWDFLAERFTVGNILAQVQFPWRYLAIAVLFLALLLGELLKEVFLGHHQKRIKWSVIMAGICIFMVCCFTENYIKSTERICFHGAEEIGTYEVGAGGEYLLADTDITVLSNEISGNFKEAKLLSRDGTRMELFVDMGNTGGSIEVPLFAYKGYCVKDEQGKEYIAGAGSNNRLRFKLPAGYTGKIYIDFHEPWYWRMAEMISVVSFICLLFRTIQNIFYQTGPWQSVLPRSMRRDIF